MNKLNIILATLLAIVVWFWVNQVGKTSLVESQVKSLQAENREYRNKNGQLISEKLAFEGDRSNLKAQIEVMRMRGDSLLFKVSRATNGIHYLKRVIAIIGSGDVVPVKRDTVWQVGPVTIDTPLIAIDTSDKYHSFKFAGNLKKYAYQVRVIDNSELATSSTRNGTLVKLINHNPYVVQSDVQSLIVKKKRPSVWSKVAWFSIGLGAGLFVF